MSLLNNTLPTASDLGTLNGSLTVNDFVGTTDPRDYFRFTLAQNAGLNLVLRSNPALNVSLIADLNNNGVVDTGETVTSGSTSSGDLSVFPTLPGGSYIVLVEQRFGSSANYELTLTETPRPGNVSPDPGNTLPAAFDLGTLSGTRTIKDYIGRLDETDVYKFRLTDNSDLNVTAKGFPGDFSGRVSVALIADLNNNGVIDSGERQAQIIGDATGTSFSRALPNGTYFLVADPFISSSAQYEITLANTTRASNISRDPGNAITSAFNLGALSGTRTIRDYVGDLDASDVYKFTLTQNSTVNFTFTGLSPNNRGVSARLIADLNNNGVVDFGETLNSGGGINTSFSSTLEAGTYFFSIAEFLESTNYQLRIASTPDFSGNDRLRGTSRNDRLRGYGGNDYLIGLGGNDRLIGDAGRDRLDGGTGNDDLRGGADRDVLLGGSGNDRLDGGTGNDTITTGTGRDIIVLGRGQGFDRVTDFQDGQDKIDLVGLRFGQLTIRQQRDDVLIKLGNTDMMLLEDVSSRRITSADFV